VSLSSGNEAITAASTTLTGTCHGRSRCPSDGSVEASGPDSVDGNVIVRSSVVP